MSPTVHIEAVPALKMILHAAKYAESPVNGLLLAKRSSDLTEQIVVTNYVPLFHSPLNLAPMLEVALCQVEAYCSTDDLRICGYFQANEHIHDREPTTFACKIAEKLNEKSGPACMVILRNDRLYPPNSDKFSVYGCTQGKWNEVKYTLDTAVQNCLQEAIKSKLDNRIHDFDDHLNDVRCDFLNPELSERLHAILCE